MRKSIESTNMFIIHILIFFTLQVAYVTADTALERYVRAPDPTYSYKLNKSENNILFTSYYINMTSQKWLTSDLVSQSIWYHQLVINVPTLISNKEHAFMYITGGHNGDDWPKYTSQDLLVARELTLMTGLITATLFQIPNQPIVFREDPLQKRRSEDAIIAFTWAHFVKNTSDPDYLLRLPMTKACVRALDTIEDFLKKEHGFTISKFGIAGASKRGWATWTTGIVDKRVIAIAPIVMDLLNAVSILHHMYKAYDGWTFAFKDYYEMNITGNLDSEAFKQLLAIVDPYSYLDQLQMPKLLINTGGDEFFMPDDNYYFWNDLKEPKYLDMLPNAEHSIAGHVLGVVETIGNFLERVIKKQALPQLKWTFNNTVGVGRIYFYTDTEPTDITLWHANTEGISGRRDFRLLAGSSTSTASPQLIPWFKRPVKQTASGVYLGEVNVPSVGWTAFFIRATFETSKGARLTAMKLSSQVNIVPETFPFKDCHGSSCLGKLV